MRALETSELGSRDLVRQAWLTPAVFHVKLEGEARSTVGPGQRLGYDQKPPQLILRG